MYAGALPYLTADQMREVDRLMIEHYQIALIQMMENAGHHLAHLARHRFLGGDSFGKRVTLLAGSGGNGGGALVCARWLHNAGATVEVFLAAEPASLAPVPAQQFNILRHMGVPIRQAGQVGSGLQSDLVIDGLIGYSLTGAPRGESRDLIAWANASSSPVLALDVPSGIDSTSGTKVGIAIHATATMTLALPKVGFAAEAARSCIGELYLAHIGVPVELYAHPSLQLTVEHIFRQTDIVRLW